jgi:electron transfer flavoprotein alpha subunit
MGIDKIWIFGEANGDAVASITLEMLAAARELADTIEVFMAGDGDDYAEELGEHGAETVYSTGDLDHPGWARCCRPSFGEARHRCHHELCGP